MHPAGFGARKFINYRFPTPFQSLQTVAASPSDRLIDRPHRHRCDQKLYRVAWALPRPRDGGFPT
jgi:hypothetical protein